jgi:hypothetical protein
MELKEVLVAQLKSLLRKLGQDFAYDTAMVNGFAILSFVDEDLRIHAIPAERGRANRITAKPEGWS